MRPDLETYLWDRIRMIGVGGTFPRTIIKQMVDGGMIASPKQAWATLEKWSARKWYDYGVSLDLGWRVVRERK